MKPNYIGHFGKTSLLFCGGVALDCLASSVSSMPSDSALLGCPTNVLSGVLAIGTNVIANGIFEQWQKGSERLNNQPTPLEEAMMQIMQNTINDIRNEIASEYQLDTSQHKWVFRLLLNKAASSPIDDLNEEFLYPLLFHLTDDKAIEEMLVLNSHLKPDEYLLKIITTVTPIYYKEDHTLLKQFSENVAEKFKRLFKSNLLKELDGNERAKTGYFTYLLETILLKVNEVYANQGEKLSLALNVLQEFKSETKASSEEINRGFHSIRMSITAMLTQLDNANQKLDMIVGTLNSAVITKEVVVEKEVFVEKIIYRGVGEISIEDLNERWEAALADENILIDFLEMYSPESNNEKISEAAYLEQAFNLAFLRSKDKTIASSFGRLSILRFTLYAQLLLHKDNLPDEMCNDIIHTALSKAASNSYANVVKAMVENTVCKNSNKSVWAGILLFMMGRSRFDSHTFKSFYSLDEYALNRFDLNNPNDFDKIATGFNSRITLERISTALTFGCWAENKMKNPSQFPYYYRMLDNLHRLLSGTFAERITAIFCYRCVFLSGYTEVSNPTYCREKERKAFIDFLADSSAPQIVLPDVVNIVGKIYQTEYM